MDEAQALPSKLLSDCLTENGLDAPHACAIDILSRSSFIEITNWVRIVRARNASLAFKGGDMKMRPAAKLLAVALCLASSVAWSTPILDGGWDTTDSDLSGYTDHINQGGALNVGGAYLYSLTDPATFRITDVLVAGDVWEVFDFGVSILTTTLQSFASGFGDNVEADAAWTDNIHTKGEVLLAAGNHSITVSGNGVGGLPAHYFARIDSVPEPSSLLLLALGLVVIALRRVYNTGSTRFV